MTTQKIVIRSETKADVGLITGVTVAAFATMEISRHTEQFIIEALRSARALTLSLVAEVDGRVVGHIAFSVCPEYQRRGIGKALIQEGLSRLKELGEGCCLVGHPEYYRKFGFDTIPELVHEGVPPEVFLALSFDGSAPQGIVTSWWSGRRRPPLTMTLGL